MTRSSFMLYGNNQTLRHRWLLTFMSSQTSRLLFGSIPVVGSSRNITLGLPIKLMTMVNLLLIPPLIYFTGSSLASYNETKSSIDLISRSISSFANPNNHQSTLIIFKMLGCTFDCAEHFKMLVWCHLIPKSIELRTES